MGVNYVMFMTKLACLRQAQADLANLDLALWSRPGKGMPSVIGLVDFSISSSLRLVSCFA
jgi:hypothetical protein